MIDPAEIRPKLGGFSAEEASGGLWLNQDAYSSPPDSSPPDNALSEEALKSLFAAPVGAAMASPGGASMLLPGEQGAIRHAVPARQLEFAGGRSCARLALEQVGCPDARRVGIPAGADRAPIWPAGYVGSISHCRDLCCAVAAPRSSCRSLGIDVETWVDLEPAMINLICTANEIEQFRSDPTLPLARLALLAFSAKEAFYKAYHPLTKRFLEFEDLSIRLLGRDSDSGGFHVHLSPALPMSSTASDFIGRWCRVGNHIYTGVTCP